MKELQVTTNEGSIIGVLQEKQLELVMDKNRVVTAIQGKLVIRCGADDFLVRVYVSKFRKDGKTNSFFEGVYTIYKDYIAQNSIVNNEKQADVVNCNIKLSMNDYFNEHTKKVSSRLVSQFNNMKRLTDLETPHEGKVRVLAYIRSIEDELTQEGVPSGRLKVMLYGITFKGELNPMACIVNEDLAEDFRNVYREQDTAEFILKFVNHRVGKVQEQKPVAFGDSNESDPITTSGYDILEYHLVKGTNPIDDEEEKLDVELMKKAEQERVVKLENLGNSNQSNNKSATNSSPSPFSSEGFAAVSDEEIPF